MAPTDKEVAIEKENTAPAQPKRKVSARVQAVLDACANVPAKPQIEGDVIDLNDEDNKHANVTPETEWYLRKVGTFKPPKSTGKTPPKVTNYKQLKDKLGKSLAEQRRRGMKERYEVYNADNEIYGAEKDDDEEDEEEEAVLSDEEEEQSEAPDDDEENDADVEDEAEEHEAGQKGEQVGGEDAVANDDPDAYSQFTIYAQRIPSPRPLSESDFGDSEEQDVGPENAPAESTTESQENDYVDDAPQLYDMWGADLGYAKEGEDFIALGTQDDDDAAPDDDLLMLCSANFPVKASEQLPADASYGEIVSQTALKTTEEDGGWDDIVSQPNDPEQEQGAWEDLDSQAHESQAALDRSETQGFLSPTKQSRDNNQGEETASKAAYQESPNKAYLRQLYEDDEGTRDTFYAASDDEDITSNTPNRNASLANTTNRLNFGDDSSDEEEGTDGAANAIKPSATSENMPDDPISNEKVLVEDQPDKNLVHDNLPTQLDSDDEAGKDELPPRKRQHRIIVSDDEDDDSSENAKKRFKESRDDDASRAMAELSMEPLSNKETVARAAGVRAALDDSSDDDDERPTRSVTTLAPTDFTALDSDLFTVEDEVEENINVQYEEEEEEADAVVDDEDEVSRESEKVDANKLKDLFDDEASLSGDDVGSDNDEEGDNENEYEAEEGDHDVLPEEEEIRNQLVKQYIRQQNNDDERRLLLLQEQFFADGDLAGPNMDRGFRFRLRDDEDIDWAKLLGALGEDGTDKVEEEDQELDPELHAKRVAMLKWKLEQAQKASEQKTPCLLEDDADNSLFDFAGKIVVEETHTVTAGNSASSKICKESLLTKASSLGIILKDGVPAVAQDKRSHGLFTAQTKKT